jgi:mannitol-1-phosphate 5-dehydrogenase
VPPIHDNLAALARRAREAGALTVCGTVYDFRNEQRNPSAPWPLGGTEEAYPWIDLLITDREEILRLTNAEGVSEAVSQVLDRGTGAVVVTQGTEPTIAAVNPDKETAFAPPARRSYPVSRAVSRDLSTGDNSRAAVGDTTGCGDNFVGGVLTALAMQLEDGRPPLDLHHALGWGTASGGFACFYPGGLYREEGPGEKRGRIEPYLRNYLAQLAEDGVGDAVPMELRPYLGGLVQFGAGNIGRSFIGQLFARAGYPVIFVDIDEEIIGELNRRHAYPVVLRRADEPPEQLSVEGVAAVHASDEETVKAVVAAAAVVATSVGARALKAVYPLLAGGVARRFAGRAPRAPRAPRPLDIIIAENIPDGNAVFRRALEPMLPESVKIGRDIGLVETSIGKMVPLITEADRRADPLRVFAEEYNTLIVDARAFSGAMPAVPDVRAVDNIRAYVDRKLYIHNLGHAAVAYWGNRLLPSATYIAECVEVPEVHSRAAAAMHSAAAALHEQYPEDLSADELADHVVDLLARFGNHALQDTVYRVGRDLTRKLAKDERLVGALRLCISHGIPAAPIADVIVAALGFNAHDENGEPAAGVVDVRTILARDGIEGVIREVCGLDGSRREDPAAAEAIRTAYRRA